MDSLLIFLLLLASHILALSPNLNECKAVNVVIEVLQAEKAQASSFCTSFLHIKTQTHTTTSTTTSTDTVSVVTPITTLSETETATTSTTVTVSAFASDTAPSAQNKRSNDLVEEREIAQRQGGLLSILEKFAQKEISTACSCLSLTTPTATLVDTVTATTSVTTTAPVLTVTDIVATVTVTETSTSTIYVNNACATSLSYDCSGDFTGGTTVTAVPGTSLMDCCTLCFETPNCMTYVYNAPVSFCQLRLGIDQESPATAQCPLGLQPVTFGCVYEDSTGESPGPCLLAQLSGGSG